MATVIDTLLVALGFETSDFKKGQKEVQEGLKKTSEESAKRAKEIEARAKVTAEAFKKVRAEVLGMVGALVSVSGIKSFVDRISTADAAVGRLSENLGIGVNKLAAWQKMSASFGGSPEDMSAAFRNINRIVQGVATGTDYSALTPLGKLMGGEDLSKFLDRATTVEERMKLVQRAIARAPNRQNALTYAQQAGFTEETFTVMREIGDKIDEIIAKYERLNTVTGENVETSKRLKQQWNDMYQAGEALGRVLMYTLAPALEWVMKKAGDVLTVVGEGRIGGALWDFLNMPKESTGDAAADAEYDRRLGAARFAPSGGRRSGKPTTAPAAAPAPAATPAQRMSSGGPADWRDAAQIARDEEAARIIRGELASATDPKLRAGLQRELDALARFGDTGRRFTPANYSRSVMTGAAGASRSAAKAGASTSTTEVNVGTVNVTTQATDANGIARDIVGALQANYSLATQSAQGLR